MSAYLLGDSISADEIRSTSNQDSAEKKGEESCNSAFKCMIYKSFRFYLLLPLW